MRTAYTVDGHKVTVVTEIRENVFEVMQHFLWEHGDEDEEYTEEYSSIYHGRLFDDPPCKATHSKLKELEVQVKQHQELIGNLNDEISRLLGSGFLGPLLLPLPICKFCPIEILHGSFLDLSGTWNCW